MQTNCDLMGRLVIAAAEITDRGAVTQLGAAALRAGSGNFVDETDGQVLSEVSRGF